MKGKIIAIPEREKYYMRVAEQIELILGKWPQIFVDHDKHGPWFNLKNALQQAAKETEPSLIVQDDMILNVEAIQENLNRFKILLKNWPFVSLFTPPRKALLQLKEQGYSAIESYQFMWGPITIYTPQFARQVLEYSKELDDVKCKYHDEMRIGHTLQRTNQFALTLLGSFGNHDLSIKSSLGTPAKIGKVVRNTQIQWSGSINLNNFRVKTIKSQTDYSIYQ